MKRYIIEVKVMSSTRRELDNITLHVEATSQDDARCLVMNTLMEKYKRDLGEV